MMETLREVSTNLWVSDIESAAIVGDDFALVVDCTGKARIGKNGIHARPTGATGHAWTVKDLDWITDLASTLVKDGRPVLVHCRRGVSRSPCAAAAVLLALGLAKNVDHALSKTKVFDTVPASQSVAGLRKWWKTVQDRRQLALPLSAK